MAHGKLWIGWSRGDITPAKKTLLQGQFHARISREVISPLTATALALEVRGSDGTADQAVLLSCDLTGDGFKADLLRELVTELSPESVETFDLENGAPVRHVRPTCVRGGGRGPPASGRQARSPRAPGATA